MRNILKKMVVASLGSMALFASGTVFGADEEMSGRTERQAPVDERMGERSALQPSVGILGGYSTLNGSEFSNNASGMVEVGIRPIKEIGLAAQGQYMSGDELIGAQRINVKTTNVLLKAVWNVGGGIPIVRDSFIGGKSGVSINTGDVEQQTNFALGPTVGFDIPVDRGKHFTLGAEGTYLSIIGTDKPDQISGLGAAKYWF